MLECKELHVPTALNSALPQPASCTAVRKDNTTLYKHTASMITA